MRVVSFRRRMHNIAEIFRFRLAYVNNLVRYGSLARNGWRYYRRLEIRVKTLGVISTYPEKTAPLVIAMSIRALGIRRRKRY